MSNSRSNPDIVVLYWYIAGHPGYVVNFCQNRDNFCQSRDHFFKSYFFFTKLFSKHSDDHFGRRIQTGDNLEYNDNFFPSFQFLKKVRQISGFYRESTLLGIGFNVNFRVLASGLLPGNMTFRRNNVGLESLGFFPSIAKEENNAQQCAFPVKPRYLSYLF